MRLWTIPLCALALVGCAAQEPAQADEEQSKPEPVTAQRPALEFEVESRFDYDTTMETLKAAATAEKYGVQGVHPISDILNEKGFPRDRLAILEVCNPGAASTTLNNDVRAGLHMPCPIMVYEKDGKVMVMTFDTRTMATMYDGPEMSATGESVYNALRKILDSVDASIPED